MYVSTLCHGDSGGMGDVAHPQGSQEVLGGGGIHYKGQHHYPCTVEQNLWVWVGVVVREFPSQVCLLQFSLLFFSHCVISYR